MNDTTQARTFCIPRPRSLGQFLFEHRWRFPNVRNTTALLNQVKINLLYFQTNYLIASLAMFAVLMIVSMKTLLTGIVSAIILILAALFFFEHIPQARQIKQNHPTIVIVCGIVLIIVTWHALHTILLVVGIALSPLPLWFMHAAVRSTDGLIDSGKMGRDSFVHTPVGQIMQMLGIEPRVTDQHALRTNLDECIAQNLGIDIEIFKDLSYQKTIKEECKDPWINEPIKAKHKDSWGETSIENKPPESLADLQPSKQASPELKTIQPIEINETKPLLNFSFQEESISELNVEKSIKLEHHELDSRSVIQDSQSVTQDFSDLQISLLIKDERDTKEKANYNLRRKPSKVARVRKPFIWINKKLDTKCFRDRALQRVDFDTYHGGLVSRDECMEWNKLLESSKKLQRSQLDKFTYNSRKFIITTWLSVVRIFEYNHDKAFYFEVKRLPQRYIDMHSNMITSVHYDSEKVYIAYMTSLPKKAAIEIRDLKSRLLCPPYLYDETIESIQSDGNFIYVKTINNVIHIHRKKLFHLISYHIDLDAIVDDYVLSVRAEVTSNSPYTKYNLFVTTKEQFIVIGSDAFKTSVVQNFNLDSRYETISAHHVRNLIVMHRNLIDSAEDDKFKSRLEVGILVEYHRDRHYFFIPERTISYDYLILHVEIGSDDNIILFGRNDQGRYEASCINTENFSPLWNIRVVDEVDDNARILVHDDHLVVITQPNQKISSISIEGSKFNDCQMLQGSETQINVNIS